MAQGHVVDAFEHGCIDDPGAHGKYLEYNCCQPDSVEASGCHESDRGEAYDDDLNSEAGEDGGIRGALAAESAVVDFLGRRNRKEVADGEIDGQREENSSDRGGGGSEGGGLVEKCVAH